MGDILPAAGELENYHRHIQGPSPDPDRGHNRGELALSPGTGVGGTLERSQSVNPKDLHIVQIKLRLSIDKRPCVIVEPPIGNRVKIAVISSAMDLYNRTTDFLIDSSHQDFPATGLTRTCYITGNFVEAPISRLSKNAIGRLEGNLERQFDKWFG